MSKTVKTIGVIAAIMIVAVVAFFLFRSILDTVMTGAVAPSSDAASSLDSGGGSESAVAESPGGGEDQISVDPNGLWLPKSTDGNPYSAALNEAKSYNRNHYSKKRIYKLLILFGFNSDVAQYTIDHLYADYKANALAKAREYRKYSNLSKTEIYERLTSPYFRKFTKEEANYAIQKLGDK